MGRIKLTIEYDGSEYVGWQKQQNGRSIQEEIEICLEKLFNSKIKKNEAQINWEKDAHEINQKIKAFSPKPGAWTIIRNSDTRIKILKANIIKEKDYQKKD